MYWYVFNYGNDNNSRGSSQDTYHTIVNIHPAMFVKNEARGVLMVKMVSFITQINDIILNAELLCHDGAKRIFFISP